MSEDADGSPLRRARAAAEEHIAPVVARALEALGRTGAEVYGRAAPGEKT